MISIIALNVLDSVGFLNSNLKVFTYQMQIFVFGIKRPRKFGGKMTQIEQARHILRLIETVDPNDTAILDEIDARFWCLRNGYEFHPYKARVSLFAWEKSGNRNLKHYETVPKYTRSLDACQAAMPEGWYLLLVNTDAGATIDRIGFVWFACLKRLKPEENDTQSPSLPTAPLAWLHAIVQAMIFEMENRNEH
jgi:hypothetical protein